MSKNGKEKVKLGTTQTDGGMFNDGIELNYIIGKLQNNLSPPASLHFKYNNSPITWGTDGNRNRTIKWFSHSHTSQLASQIRTNVKGLISRQKDLSIVGSTNKALAHLKSLNTITSPNLLEFFTEKEGSSKSQPSQQGLQAHFLVAVFWEINKRKM